MKKLLPIFALVLLIAAPARAGFWDDIKKSVKEEAGDVLENKDKPQTGTLSEEKIIAGLREALDIGTKKAVEKVSKLDGYHLNPAIMIPFPPKIEKAASALRKIGMGKELDRFVLSMNRAAERAAPRAVDIFVSAISEMNISEARAILKGNDTAATEYFRTRTEEKLGALFRPEISASMDKVGVTRNFKSLMKRYASLPLVKEEYIDLDEYVTREALDGLFHMVGQEEKLIRKDPGARVSSLLREVFAD